MKLIKIFILLTFLSILCVLIGCGKQIAGTYVDENHPGDYLELRRDGTFCSYHSYYHGKSLIIEKLAEGKWVATKNEVRLIVSKMGTEIIIPLKVEKNKIIDEEGGVWIKKRLKNHFRRMQ